MTSLGSSPQLKQPIPTVAVVCALVAASLSIIYTVLSDFQRATDLSFFHEIATAWVNGNYTDTLRYNIYPPSTPVIFSPFASMSFETLRGIWFVINLLLTALSVYLTIKLIGPNWTWRAQYFLLGFVISWGPFRINQRNGQITMVIAALLLGSFLAWRRNRNAIAGLLLGLALCKYILAFPFLIYFVWKKQWELVLIAISTFAGLVGVYSIHLNLNPITVFIDYVRFVGQMSVSFTSSADLNSLVVSITGSPRAALIISLFVMLSAVISFLVVVIRRRPSINLQLALVTLFTLWAIYHRSYDFMLCMIPVAVLIDFVVNRRLITFSYIWLGVFAVFVLAIPGFAVGHGEFDAQKTSPLLALLIHLERLVVFAAFWALLWVLWKRGPNLDQRAG